MLVARPEVSVSIITYNQKDIIGRAIESALHQRTTFPFGIIIGDDCSDDGTQEVLRAYQEKHADKIQIILHPRRYKNEVPGRTNNLTNLLNCRGRYIAMLDGDDYWTDPYKLQKQYDRLEAQPNLAICLHNMKIEYGPEIPPHERIFQFTSEGKRAVNISRILSHEDIAARRYIHPVISSAMYRADYLRPLPEWMWKIVAADYALVLLLSKRGDVFYDDTAMGVYYRHGAGFMLVHQNEITILRQRLEDIDTYLKEFPAVHLGSDNTKRRARLHERLLTYSLRRRRFRDAVLHMHHMVDADPKSVVTMMLRPARHLYKRVSVLSRHK